MTANRQTNKDFFSRYKDKKNLEINEVWRLREILNNKYQSDILILLINKMLYYNNTNKLLNNDGEFYKPREEMKMDIGIAPDTITNNLKKLQKYGWLKFENKPIENNKFRWSLHFILNTEKIENEILESGDVNLNNKYWEMRGDFTPNNKTLRRQNEVVKPNPFDTTKKKNTPKVETTDNKITDNSIATTYKPNDDDNSNDELIGISIEDDEMIDNDVKEFKPIVERDNDDEMIGIGFKELKPAVEPLNEIEIINNKNENDTTIMRETNNETLPINTDTDDDDDNIELNERVRLILKYKDYEEVKPVLKDLMLSNETLNNLCSDTYKIGIDEKLDDKKQTLDILFDVFIKKIIKKENE